MKLKQSLRDLKNTQDPNLLDQIEDDHPPDWYTDQMFEKSYRHYLKQSSKKSISVIYRNQKQNRIYRTLGLVASLIMTVSLGLGIWSRLPRIETIPAHEKETVTTTVKELDSDTICLETVVTNESFIINTFPHTNTSSRITTQFQTVDETELSETQVSLNSTQTAVESTNIITDVKEPVNVSTNKVSTSSLSTEIVSDAMHRITFPIDTVISTVIDAVAPTSENTSTSVVQFTETVSSETSAGTASTETEVLPGFDIIERGDYNEISFRGEVEPSPENFITYLLQDGEYDYEQNSSPTVLNDPNYSDALSISYSYYKDSEYSFSIYQFEREAFSFKCGQDTVMEYHLINGTPCVVVLDDSLCSIYWDIHGYTFCIYGYQNQKEKLLEVVPRLSPEIVNDSK